MEETSCLICNSYNSKQKTSFEDNSTIYYIVQCECGFVYLNPRLNNKQIYYFKIFLNFSLVSYHCRKFYFTTNRTIYGSYAIKFINIFNAIYKFNFKTYFIIWEPD